MQKKILLILLFILASFIVLSSITNTYAGSAQTYTYSNVTITIPSRFFIEPDYNYLSSSNDSDYVYSTFYSTYSSHNIRFHYDAYIVSSNNAYWKEYTQTDVNTYATQIEAWDEDYTADGGYKYVYTVMSKNLTKISGVSAVKVRYKCVAYNADGSFRDVNYYDNYYVRTDRTNFEIEVTSEDNIDYLNSVELSNVISNIIIRDTVSKTRVTPFTDVQLSDWYYNSVKYNYTKGIILGTNDYNFSPSSKLTRGMIVTILYRMEGAPKVTAANRFSDVSSSKYYYNAVRWASANKIVNGYTGTSKFGPEDYVTREQLAVMLSAYCNYKGKYKSSTKALTSYSDTGSISSWAKDAMRWAVNNKIINGSSGKLNPKGTATRAEAATMIYNYCSKF